MKTFFVIFLYLFGAALGLYVGGQLLFLGGITQAASGFVVNLLTGVLTVNINLFYGLLKMLLSGIVSIIIFLIFANIGNKI